MQLQRQYIQLPLFLPKTFLILCIAAVLVSAVPSAAQTTNGTDTIQQRTMPMLEVRPGKSHTLADYRATATRINDLVSTRLEVRFDFSKCYLYGREWITLTPHFYSTDSLTLDAKGMVIHEVALVTGKTKKRLHYRYDSMQLHINLGRAFRRGQKYTLYIDYTSRPNEYAASNPGGSAAIVSDKGLYFINPDGKDPYKPTEVWTQGETQSNSVWFPTIDRPDQKTMEEISMTVPDKFTTLSNGLLISRKKNRDGTRTDTWRMKHPNSPYLFMMAAGPFVVVKDHWKNIPVNYYVEKKYAPYAKAIFGHTPAMIAFYSKILGMPYQWTKYDQIVGRDYVSGAMENTTATLHGEFMYQTTRQLQDAGYRNESVIAHELFHHWFGDLVTCESWSNITVNESFADFSEMLWAEHEYGKDLADQHSYQAAQQYFDYAGSGKDHPLVDFYYKDREDVFDQVTYQKGGRILNMLRNYVGDSAFFHSLHYYLEQHKFQPAEAQDLRLAFEHVTGRDLNWFWNEWYYGQGYPKLDIRYDYNDALHLVHVIVTQTQQGQVFELPFAIDVYAAGKKERHQVVMMSRTDTFSYHYRRKPDLINVDGDKVLLAKRNDHKSIHNFVYQYHHAGLYLDRLEAIEACAKAQDTSEAARQLLADALNDPFYGIQNEAIQALDMKNDQVGQLTVPILKKLLQQDKHSAVRAAALSALTDEDPAAQKELVTEALKDSSLHVEATALGILEKIDPAAAYRQAKAFEKDAEAPLTQVVCAVLAKKQNPEDFAYIRKNLEENGSFSKFGYLHPFLYMLSHAISDTQVVQNGLDQVKSFAEGIGPRYGVYVIGMLSNFATAKRNAADAAADANLKSMLSGQADYARKLVEQLQASLTQ
jgi:aminopeptidase N